MTPVNKDYHKNMMMMTTIMNILRISTATKINRQVVGPVEIYYHNYINAKECTSIYPTEYLVYIKCLLIEKKHHTVTY